MRLMKMRNLKIIKDYLLHPAGSVLIEQGKTKVICTAIIQDKVPPFLRNAEPAQGWITAEYSMLPGATNERFRRERSKVTGRTAEIQRLIGRALRAVVDLTKIPGYQIIIDCDVIQADGGTRTASITGGCVALYDAFQKMLKEKLIDENPLIELVAAISVGFQNGKVIADLDYEQDSQADVDMNIVMTESGEFVEIQGTAEGKTFDDKMLQEMLKNARESIAKLIEQQRKLYSEK